MTRFRPCIDLHAGQVKQIVGGTLNTSSDADLKTNYVSQHSAGYYAQLYREHNVRGSHVIMLGPGNEQAAREALRAWPGGLQVGGGINDGNAREWIESGAEKVGRQNECTATPSYHLFGISSLPLFPLSPLNHCYTIRSATSQDFLSP